MKRFRRSLVALLTLICLVVSFLPASAAAQPGNYSVKVEGGIVWFIRDGKAAQYTVLQPVELILRTDKDGELIVGIRTEDGYRYITLGDQKTIDVSGEIGKLVLSVSLDPGISVSVGEKSNVQELYVRNDGDVTVAGETGEVEVTGAANVTFVGSSYVETLTVTNGRASVSVKPGAVVEQAFAASGAKLSGVSAVSPLPLPEVTETDISNNIKKDRSTNSKLLNKVEIEDAQVPSPDNPVTPDMDNEIISLSCQLGNRDIIIRFKNPLAFSKEDVQLYNWDNPEDQYDVRSISIPGESGEDSYSLRLYSTLPPGRYKLKVKNYEADFRLN